MQTCQRQPRSDVAVGDDVGENPESGLRPLNGRCACGSVQHRAEGVAKGIN